MVIFNAVETERAYGKVNLYLDVISKRNDGYHNIVGLFQTIDLCDVIEFRTTDRPGQVMIQSNVRIEGMNLIEKAFRICSEYYRIDFGMEVKLSKRIPIGSGLGGGSSDAAATLRFLSKIINIPQDTLFQIAAKVGSDVPFLLRGGTAIVEGKGESVTFLEPIKDYTVNLFCPKISISTKMMYQRLGQENYGRGPKPVERLYEAYKNMDAQMIRSFSYNVFQDIVCGEYPEIKENLDIAWRENPITALMTGTGSCVFSVHDIGGKHKFITTLFDNR